MEDERRSRNPVAAHLVSKHYKGQPITAGGFTGELAKAILEAGDADLVAFGRRFILQPSVSRKARSRVTIAPAPHLP
ncbi:hypothetical protein [Pseudomonas sp. BN417]|uniref:hypothetical protein n=1 Tax=Pseudomonas sp. BN417 TaxID=2567890 RepID=UPI00245901F4|nr:hypothetical protein [Pseudomonas sp. BN417]